MKTLIEVTNSTESKIDVVKYFTENEAELIKIINQIMLDMHESVQKGDLSKQRQKLEIYELEGNIFVRKKSIYTELEYVNGKPTFKSKEQVE